MGLRVEHPQRLQRPVRYVIGELFRKDRRRVQGVADPGCGGRELFEHRPRWVPCIRVRHPVPGVAQHGPAHFTCEGVAGGQEGDCIEEAVASRRRSHGLRGDHSDPPARRVGHDRPPFNSPHALGVE